MTGAAGFIGSHLVRKLIDHGHKVIGVDDLSAGKLENLQDLSSNNFKFEQADITDRNRMRDIFEVYKPSTIYHLAASKKNICLADPHRDLEVNGGGTLTLLQLSIEFNIKKFVHSSTGSVYGENPGETTEDSPLSPVSYYGVSKLAGERYVNMYHQQYGLNTTILRYHHVYGSRQEDDPKLGGVIAIWITRMRVGLPLSIYGSGLQTRCFTHVSDVVEANIKAGEILAEETAGSVFNIASGDHINLIQALKIIADGLGIKEINTVFKGWLEGDIVRFNVNNARSRDKLQINYKPFKEGLIWTLKEREKLGRQKSPDLTR